MNSGGGIEGRLLRAIGHWVLGARQPTPGLVPAGSGMEMEVATGRWGGGWGWWELARRTQLAFLDDIDLLWYHMQYATGWCRKCRGCLSGTINLGGV